MFLTRTTFSRVRLSKPLVGEAVWVSTNPWRVQKSCSLDCQAFNVTRLPL